MKTKLFFYFFLSVVLSPAFTLATTFIPKPDVGVQAIFDHKISILTSPSNDQIPPHTYAERNWAFNTIKQILEQSLIDSWGAPGLLKQKRQ